MGAYYGVRRTDSDGGGGNGSGSPPSTWSRRTPTTLEGDGQEHDEARPERDRRRPRRPFWETEDYRAASTFGNLKNGVGIVFDAGRPVKARLAHGRLRHARLRGEDRGRAVLDRPLRDRLVVADGRDGGRRSGSRSTRRGGTTCSGSRGSRPATRAAMSTR